MFARPRDQPAGSRVQRERVNAVLLKQHVQRPEQLQQQAIDQHHVAGRELVGMLDQVGEEALALLARIERLENVTQPSAVPHVRRAPQRDLPERQQRSIEIVVSELS